MENNVNKLLATYRQNFNKLYRSTIAPMYMKYEVQRKSKLTECYIVCTLLLFFVALIAFDVFSGTAISRLDNAGDGISVIVSIVEFILGIVLLVIACWYPLHCNAKFVEMLKTNCMSKILALFGNIQWLSKVKVIDDIDLDSSDLFEIYNRREDDDGFEGKFKGVDFQISETYLHRVTGSGKNRSDVTVFKGVIVKFKANKDIKYKTVVASRGDRQIKRKSPIAIILSIFLCSLYVFHSLIFEHGIVAGLIICGVLFVLCALCYGIYAVLIKPHVQTELPMNEVKLEDTEFSKKYVAYSANQVEARYLITPAFMERFKNIQTSFGTDKVKCSFYDDNLMFAISTRKNLFELGNIFKNLNDPKQMEDFFNEITSLFMFVDYFKLDETIGL